MKRSSLSTFFFGVTSLLSFAIPGWALESDSKQPLYIESNTANYDEKQGESVYIGDVHVTQGSMELFADRMIVYMKAGKTDKIIATGNPVRLKQTPDGAKDDIKGTSKRSEYYPDKTTLVLLEDAVVIQGGNTYASQRIEYDSRNATVRAGQPATAGSRVRVKLMPKPE